MRKVPFYALLMAWIALFLSVAIYFWLGDGAPMIFMTAMVALSVSGAYVISHKNA
ncbi:MULTISPECIES: hypothetical protein [unclassified Corynebacterium]|uniref:hypothetical protein n=1 Tax=unclassified Corynebacterium TaxID=2624378 RepID=UPI00143D83C0|nr:MULTISPECIES: hypothetical protein [unclassified Corynebacterium]